MNTSKQIGDKDHIKVFANVDAEETWFARTILEAWHSSTRYCNKPPRLSDLRTLRRVLLVLDRGRPIVDQCCILVTRAFGYER